MAGARRERLDDGDVELIFGQDDKVHIIAIYNATARLPFVMPYAKVQTNKPALSLKPSYYKESDLLNLSFVEDFCSSQQRYISDDIVAVYASDKTIGGFEIINSRKDQK
ncbi:hypothetical protein CAOG_07481 [Capsaspora owczarzaki ATCC 30864]|uniref:Uncharacterized protein n=1 Tax=Capsaspora owczarzaki (strain ATCC 30864) TaxID=595528 RepID=A0A0D2UPR7_CAPO3|nr:hypothetical protein CAOG_07481 [Capsaspora owczarzaki ATCC 30864]KJE96991.1 hypothetical protein CAOG_007481 [Capsaspora owczarzaki ATCC 30864]|eukprot:XP_004343355.1 hypothetical protein CAOG_07481 [Capsaspora owczarzaki ATCC 30864]